MSEIFLIKDTGKGQINNLDPKKVVPVTQNTSGTSSEGIETVDSSTVTFTGDGTEGNPLSAESTVTVPDGIQSIQEGLTIKVDNTDSLNPIIDVKVKPYEIPVSTILADLSSEELPYDMVTDSEGSCFVSSFYGNKILKITKGGIISTIATITSPSILIIDSNDNLFVVSDYQLYKITPDDTILISNDMSQNGLKSVKIDADNNIFTIYSNGNKSTLAKFTIDGNKTIISNALDSNSSMPAKVGDYIYFVHHGTYSVNKIDILGNISTVYTSSSPINDLVVSTSGDLYVLRRNFFVTKISQNGQIEEISTGVAFPRSMVVDEEDYMYITTTQNNIVIVPPNGNPYVYATTGDGCDQITLKDGNLYTLNATSKNVSKISSAPKGILKLNDNGEIETLKIIDAQNDSTFSKQLVARPDQTFGFEDKLNNSYSTEETKTGGTWIDGKPIYRKVIPFHIVGDRVTIDLPANRGVIVDHKLTIFHSDGRYISTMYHALGGGQFINVGLEFQPDADEAVVRSYRYDINTPLVFTPHTEDSDGFVTIEYTKTTD